MSILCFLSAMILEIFYAESSVTTDLLFKLHTYKEKIFAMFTGYTSVMFRTY